MLKLLLFILITNKLKGRGNRMLRIRNMLICGLVLSFIIIGCGQKEEQPEYAEPQVKEEASQIKESIAKPAEEMAAKGSKIIEQAKSDTELAKDKTASIIKELIAKANTLLNQGKFEEAIAAAQDVLNNHDSDSQEAKDIITKAKEKLKAIATEKIEGIKGDVTDKLKGFGQ